MKSVAVITATTGRASLQQAIDSVAEQTYPNVHHYVIADGVTLNIKAGRATVIELPNPTGKNGVMNGAICAAGAFIATEDYVTYLDDDNWFEPNHIESLVTAIGDNAYAYSLRKLVEPDGTFWANDDGESLGHFGEMVDANCLMMLRNLAIGTAPLCMSSTPDGGSTWDRVVWNALQQHKVKWAATGQYTVNYRMDSRTPLKHMFFLRNIQTRAQFPDGFPWAT